MNLKYFGRKGDTLLCKNCFQVAMNMNDNEWDKAVADFKSQGCQLF